MKIKWRSHLKPKNAALPQKQTYFTSDELGVISHHRVKVGEIIILIHVGDDISDTLMGSLWLNIMQLVVNKPRGILTLEMVAEQ